MLKYLARHPVPRLTVAGGIGKMAKLAQGAMDLHSGRSQVDFARLAELAARAGADPAPVGGGRDGARGAGGGRAAGWRRRWREDALAVVRRRLRRGAGDGGGDRGGA